VKSGVPPGPREIRRYGNRKLYDPALRRYVTLEDLARAVAEGHEIEVRDQKTGEDLTSLTLAQVLLEGVKQGASRIPRQVLHRLIRIAAAPATPPLPPWPEAPDAAGRARREVERLVSRVLGRGRLSLDDAVSLRQEVGQVVHRMVAEAQSGVEGRLRALLSHGEGVAGRSLEALRGGLEAFEAYMDETPAPATPRRASKRRRASKSRK
jgi:polyhydroxyalkanoate synthesis repressor PhaR